MRELRQHARVCARSGADHISPSRTNRSLELEERRARWPGVAFDFKADPADPEAPRVLTGHGNGVITVNIAEADDVERERRRHGLGEPYRTLLGHMRHESGHSVVLDPKNRSGKGSLV